MNNNNKIEEILDEMDDVLDRATRVPFSSHKSMVDADRIRELVNDVRLYMPHEFKDAKLVAFDRERILNEAKGKAETIISQAEKKAAAIVSQDAIVKEAKKKAYDILAKAQSNAKEIKKNANEYCNKIIGSTEKFFTVALQDIRKTKSSMK